MASLLNEHKWIKSSDILTTEENAIIYIKEKECVHERLPISDSDPLDVSKDEYEAKLNHNTSYQCQLLSEINKSNDCNTKRTLQKHNKCAVCNEIFKFQQDLVEHAAQYHPKEKAFQCRYCSDLFSNLSSLSRHARVHLNSVEKELLKTHVCEFCSKTFDCLSRLKYHLAKHTEECPFSCALCQKSFKYKFSLKKHQRTHLKNESKYKKNYCEICCKTFESNSRLKYHLTTHTEECSFSCSLCQKRFKYKFSLIKHQITHHKLEQKHKHVCEFCSKPFACRADLNRHIMVHTEERPFSCSLCKKMYKHKNSLNKHQRTHFEDQNTFKKHACEFCLKRFYDRTDWERHLRIHTGEKPFSCSLCEETFKQKKMLVRHQNIFHSNCKVFKCQDCALVFSNFKSLTHHRKSHKDLTKKHLCEFCSKSFYSIGNLKSHYSVHSEERPFPCSFCQKGFKLKNDLKTHQKKFHLQHLKNQAEESDSLKNVLQIKDDPYSEGVPLAVIDAQSVKKFEFKIVNLNASELFDDNGHDFKCTDEVNKESPTSVTTANHTININADIPFKSNDITSLSKSYTTNADSINAVKCLNDSDYQEELPFTDYTETLNTIECLNGLNNQDTTKETKNLEKTYIKEELNSIGDCDDNELIGNIKISKTEFMVQDDFYANSCPQTEITEKTYNRRFKFKVKHKTEPIKKTLLNENKCVVCNKMFKFQHDLVKHVRKFHRNIKVMKYQNNQTLAYKNRFHKNSEDNFKKQKTPLNQHVCEVCSKNFDCIARLQLHLKSHTEEHHHYCSLCNRTYKHAKSLRRHQLSHFQDAKTYKKNVCEFCSKLFICKSDLIRHLRVHTGERPFSCTLCQKSFTQNFHLKAHRINVHLEPKSKNCIKNHSIEITKCEEKSTNLMHIHVENTIDPVIATYNNVQYSSYSSAAMDDTENLCDQTSLNDSLHEISNLENSHYSKDIYSNSDFHGDLDIKNIIEISKTEYIHDETFLTVTEILEDISNAKNSFQQNQIILKNSKTESHIKHSEEDVTAQDMIKPEQLHKKITKKHFKRLKNSHLNQHICEFCSKTFNCLSGLKYHLQSHSEERVYSCSLCQKSFKYKFSLQKHQRTHFEDEETLKKHVCEFCSKRFYDRTDLNRHLRVHTGEKPFTCSLCEVSFKQKKMLVRHQNILHSDHKDFKCRDCALIFTDFKSLTDHRKSHKDLTKKHLCEFCSKAFKQIGNLKSHYSVHSDERPFSCSFCQKGFKLKNDLKTHQKKFHLQHLKNHAEQSDSLKNVDQAKDDPSLKSVPLDAVRTPNKFECAVCCKTFADIHHWKRHLRVHTEERPYSCSQCDKSFKNNYNLSAHHKIHEKQKSKECDKKSKTKFCNNGL